MAPHIRSGGLNAGSLTLRLSCIFAALIGCSERQPLQDVRSPAIISDRTASPLVDPIVDPGNTKEAVNLWSDSIKSQLGHIAEALVNSAGPQGSAVATDQIQVLDPNSLQVKEAYRGPSIRVVEVSAPAGHAADNLVHVGPDEFIEGIRELLFLSTSSQHNKASFKLFGINADARHLRTRQRLMAEGIRDGKRMQAYAVVDATWVTPAKDDGDQLPRLTTFSMPLLVQSELVGEAQNQDTPDAMFEDISSAVLGGNTSWHRQLQSGMNTWVRHIDRLLNPDFLGYHGLAVGDVDSDGLEDLYLCQPGGLPNLLFRQEADGTLADISEVAGVDWLDNSTGALLVDLDNDGDKDLALATRMALLLMENNGVGSFSLRASLPHVAMGYSPTAADYDLDGDLDLLVLRYTATDGKTGDFPTPHPFHNARNGGANVLLQNQGDFRFTDVTAASGLGVENYRFSFAASWDDYDNDGHVDLYIANDFGPNQLFRNEGARFSNESHQSGTEDWGFGMSATSADYDRDGDMDLYVSSMFSGAGNQIVAQSDFNPLMPEETRRKYLKMVRGNTLLRNSGDGRFTDVTSPFGEGFAGWAWGATFADLNNDGWEDLYVANGYISQPDKEDL